MELTKDIKRKVQYLDSGPTFYELSVNMNMFILRTYRILSEGFTCLLDLFGRNIFDRVDC